MAAMGWRACLLCLGTFMLARGRKQEGASQCLLLSQGSPASHPLPAQDLIPAVHGPQASDSLSFTSAFSSLPASSLPSLTAGSGAASPTGLASRKGSMSPPVSRKGSLAAGTAGSRGSVGRAAAAATAKPRSSKMASMPGGGEGKAGAAAGAGGRADAADEEVQRSAASWSHSAAATSAGRAAAAQRKSSASAARLSMYKQLVAGPTSSSTKHGSLHKPAAAAGAHPLPAAGKRPGASRSSTIYVSYQDQAAL